jgi:DNA polymerase (family 10)
MEAIFQAATEHGTALEINANPERLDLNDIHARRAIDLGIPLAVNTDAHAPEQLDLLHFGIATARRAWAQKQNVLNTWPVAELVAWLKNRG